MEPHQISTWNIEIPYNETHLKKKKSEPFSPGDKAELKTPMETNRAASEFWRTTKLITHSKFQIKEN